MGLFEESSQSMEIARRLDHPDARDQGLGIDQGIERDKGHMELTADRYHDPIEFLLDERAVATDSDLRTEHHVIGRWHTAPGLVSHLQSVCLAGLPCPGFVGVRKSLGQQFSDVGVGYGQVSMLVAAQTVDLGFG
jgi:hypothetical protein